jgi:ribonuclease HII
MGNLVMKRTMDYYKLVPLFIKSGLEIHEEDPVPEGLVTCFELVDEETIDAINILNATKVGMLSCIENVSVTPDIVLIDAVKINSNVETVSIIKGDQLSYSIACASILAKVSRDRLMLEIDKEYPEYGFAKHKGYGTKAHIEALKKFGKCPHHRDTFIKNFVGQNNA